VARSPFRLLAYLTLFLVVCAGLALAGWELLSSAFEARYLAKVARSMTWEVRPGPSARIRFPAAAPYDRLMGYSRLPGYLDRLTGEGWHIEAQAEISPDMARAADLGLFLPYREKDQGGITLLDADGSSLFAHPYPARVYQRFEAIPDVLVRSLLHIENRELLRDEFPTRNPAVEWDRLGMALLEKGISLVDRKRNVPGASTLPTQIEKYRHSPEGLTQTMGDKARQIGSASLRAYLDGTDTRQARRRTVLAYLNTLPLAAAPRYGEVHGLGDGLWAWYGLDPAAVNAVLAKGPEGQGQAYAAALKHSLSLIVAVRRPSYYLAGNRKALDAFTDDHLDWLAAAGIVPPEIRDLAKATRLRSPADRVDPPKPRFVDQKAANALRIRLSGLLGEPRLYDTDRLDLQARTTLNPSAQATVSSYLQSLEKPSVVAASGLYGKRLLRQDNNLKAVIYSLTLFERTPAGMLLRVQADNLNQPFDINQQTRLDLGSTAKLRTLVSYLDIIAKLHREFRKLDAAALEAQVAQREDVLAQWVARSLLESPDQSLTTLLEGAMARRYSGTPEPFYTGGGVHNFVNFSADDNSRVMDLWQATQDSVNLVYIRLMRDVIRHYASYSPGAAARLLSDRENPDRVDYLNRFVDRESRVFLRRFHQKHRDETPEQMTADLYARTQPSLRRFTAVQRYLNPDMDEAGFRDALRTQLPAAAAALSPGAVTSLYRDHAPGAYGLADRGYIAQIHPLELWVVGYLRQHPAAGLAELTEASAKERLEVYAWLFKTSRKNAQDIRIQSLLEVEAFEALHQDWKRLGYPFDDLTPSYATAIGSSGDRPGALAELMGILLNDGVRLPVVSLTELHFAAGTPYETLLRPDPPLPSRVLPAEVAQVARRALARVVASGTAGRLNGALKDDAGSPYLIGGKTGTGDHRFEQYDRYGKLIRSRVVNRTGTFVFYLGDRYFGTLTAVVPGPDAARYEFTSAIATQILKTLLPGLRPALFPGGLPPLPVAPEEAPPETPAPAGGEKVDGPTSLADPASPGGEASAPRGTEAPEPGFLLPPVVP
jgi:membrane peptidoglycan carboxypeptidase